MPRVKQPPSAATSQPIGSPPFAPPPYNLWVEPWITLEDFDGRMEQHSIESALLNAHAFKSVYDSSPLVVVGIQRLLIAILQDAINPRSEDELRELLNARRFPVENIADFRDRYAHRFDLFSEDDPFLQSRDIPLKPVKGHKLTSISKLFLEIPTGKSEVTLYLRTTDSEQVYSPATVAAGLVTISPFASSQGRGYFPSINGVPPIYVLPRGTSLFESLATALLTPTFWPSVASRRLDNAWWRRSAIVESTKELDEVGYLHSLTFPARRLRLHPERVEALCTRSGTYTAWGVRTMVFEMGETRPEGAPWWQDPFAAYRLPAEKKGSRTAKPSKKKKAEQPTPIRPQSGKAIWREFGGLFAYQNSEDKSLTRPLVIQQMAALDLAGDRASYSFQCVGVLTDGKAKTFEWVEFGFDVPPAVLNDPSAALLVDNALVFASDCGGIIATVFAKHFGGTSRKAERYLTLKTRMVDSFWAALAGDFRHFVLMMGDRQAQPPAFEEWTNTVVNTARTVFARATESIGDDAANLRLRSEGEQHCAASLYTRMKKEFNHE